MDPIITKKAIGFKPNIPIKQDSSLTYFGGCPTMPQDLTWPTVSINAGEYALSFLGQVDLDEVNELIDQVGFPETGILYFFADTSSLTDGTFDQKDGWRVLYSNAAKSSLEKRQAPENLMPCFGEQTFSNNLVHYGRPTKMDWTEQIDWSKRYYAFQFPRIPMKLVTLDCFDSDFRFELIRTMNADQVKQYESYRLSFGEPAPHILKPYFGRRSLWLLEENIPLSTIYLEIIAALLLHKVVKKQGRHFPDFAKLRLAYNLLHYRGYISRIVYFLKFVFEDYYKAFRKLPETYRNSHIISKLTDIVLSLSEKELFDCNNEYIRDKLVDVIHEMSKSGFSVYDINECLYQGYFEGTLFSLTHSSEAAKNIPEELNRMLKSHFAPLKAHCQSESEPASFYELTLHQMLGDGKENHNEGAELRTDHIMLMQFDSDRTMGWNWFDCNCLQFWIKPEDLAMQRFDRVIVTINGRFPFGSLKNWYPAENTHDLNKKTPAVPIDESVHEEYIVCLEDGEKFVRLENHLRVHYNLTPDQYRERWGLPPKYPMVAPKISKMG